MDLKVSTLILKKTPIAQKFKGGNVYYSSELITAVKIIAQVLVQFRRTGQFSNILMKSYFIRCSQSFSIFNSKFKHSQQPKVDLSNKKMYPALSKPSPPRALHFKHNSWWWSLCVFVNNCNCNYLYRKSVVIWFILATNLFL